MSLYYNLKHKRNNEKHFKCICMCVACKCVLHTNECVGVHICVCSCRSQSRNVRCLPQPLSRGYLREQEGKFEPGCQGVIEIHLSLAVNAQVTHSCGMLGYFYVEARELNLDPQAS
jgi:hypothetical protein